MSKIVKRKGASEVVTVVAEYGDQYWVVGEGDPIPWTSGKEHWEEPAPQSGDVWTSSSAEYRVLGVDEKRGFYLITRKDAWDGGRWRDGTWPGKSEGWVQYDPLHTSNVHVRELPENFLTLKERPE